MYIVGEITNSRIVTRRGVHGQTRLLSFKPSILHLVPKKEAPLDETSDKHTFYYLLWTQKINNAIEIFTGHFFLYIIINL